MDPQAPVQRQLEAYNAKDLDAFVAEYADDIEVFRIPSPSPVLQGKAAFREHYATKRFNLPGLHANVVNRMVLGNKVVDHERIEGLPEGLLEAAAIYEIEDGLIRRVWFVNAKG